MYLCRVGLATEDKLRGPAIERGVTVIQKRASDVSTDRKMVLQSRQGVRQYKQEVEIELWAQARRTESMQPRKNPVMPNATSSEMTKWGEAANRRLASSHFFATCSDEICKEVGNIYR